ncbi:unnamed protein product [Lactuca saligna]|uniref:Uncharacterized protein n=1 Tax=Lactuca saligna TaxID=75948 RepID=A0AA35VCV8_LACSI|nr:unnamed protein product [Lactuca saligna]
MSPAPTPTPRESEHSESKTQSDIRIEEQETVHNEEETSNPEVTQTHNDFVPSPPPSPKTTTTPITITPCPPPVTSQPQTSAPLSTPLIFDSIIPPTTSAEPLVLVNASDAGAKTLGFSTHVSPPISPLRQDDPDMIFGDEEEEDLGGFTYSPFQITTESEDETLVTKGQLKSLHDNIDQLLLSTKASSSESYSKAAVNSLFGTLTKEHSDNIEKMNKSVDASAEVWKTMTEKVDKLTSDTTFFMENFQSSFDSNTPKANEALSGLGSLFKAKKTKLPEVRNGLKTYHEAFQSSISSQITKLQDELATESKIMDSLDIKTEKVKVLNVKLEAAEIQVNDLLSERVVMRSCITNVIGLLSDIIETRDPMITIIARKHLAEKLRPVFAMLHRLEGVSDQGIIPK